MTKKKEIIVPEIITNVINKCDDLINQAMEREHNRFTKLIESYKNWLLNFESGHKFQYGPIIQFLQNISGKYRVGGSIEYRMLSYSHPTKGCDSFSTDSFNNWFANYKEEYKANQIWKLTQSMMKNLTDKDILSSDVRISKTPKGFCVEFQYTNNEGLFNYQTDAIEAGGHNIQCFHYRYITKIKKVTN